MKTTLFLFFLIPVLLIGCNQSTNLPHEGAWQYVSAKYVSNDTVVFEFPGTLNGSSMKIWTKNHFIFVGLFNFNSKEINSYGGGTYTLTGNRYVENILYHTNPEFVGKKIDMLLEIKNDTLIQTWPVNKDGQIDKHNYRIEKFVRAESSDNKKKQINPVQSIVL